MSNLSKITASREICNKLVEQGIYEEAILWHSRTIREGKELTDWSVMPLTDPIPHPECCIPAWTKDELDVMIGPNFSKPQISLDRFMGEGELARKMDRLIFSIYTAKSQLIFLNGAEASARALLELIEGGLMGPETCMERYFKFFK